MSWAFGFASGRALSALPVAAPATLATIRITH